MVPDRFGASAARLSRSAPVGPGRALVPLQPLTCPTWSSQNGRPAATFLAHLIASQQQEPQTRNRRRAEPCAAVDAYEAWLTGTAPVNGRKLTRTM